jgi:hypothetical protein
MRWIELFEGNGRRLSMSRLLVFLAFWPSAWITLENPTEAMMGLFLGAFVVNYLGGKSADIFMGPEKLEAANDYSGEPDDITPSKPLAKSSGATTGNKKLPF